MRALSQLSLLLAAIALLGLVVLCALRCAYPFELEWQEGGVLDHVLRVRAGQALYLPPTLDFAPFPYTPLYYWTSALLPAPGFLPMRLLSIAATLATLSILARLIYLESGERRAAFLGAGLFAAAYAFCGAWYDIARVDALALALSLASLWAVRSGGLGRALLAGLLGALAFMTKQSLLLPALFLLWPLFRRRSALTLPYIIGLLLPAGLLCAWLESSSVGVFSKTTFGLLAGHLRTGHLAFDAWLELPLWSAPLLLLSAAALRKSASSKPSSSLLVSYLCAALILSFLARTHEGGYRNAHMPAIAALALCGTLGLERLRSQSARSATIAQLAISLQLVLFLSYQAPSELLPSTADREAGERLIATLRQTEGPLFLPSQGYLARAAGHPSCVHSMAIIDLLKAGPKDPGAAAFFRQLIQALEEQRFAAILLRDVDRASWEVDLPAFLQNYKRDKQLFDDGETSLFMPASGAANRPDWLYLLRE